MRLLKRLETKNPDGTDQPDTKIPTPISPRKALELNRALLTPTFIDLLVELMAIHSEENLNNHAVIRISEENLIKICEKCNLDPEVMKVNNWYCIKNYFIKEWEITCSNDRIIKFVSRKKV